MSHSCDNFHKNLKPLYYLYKIFGLAPFSLKKIYTKNPITKSDVIVQLVILIAVAILMNFCIGDCNNNLLEYQQAKVLFMVTSNTLRHVTPLVILANIVSAYVKKGDLISMVRLFEKFDQIFSEHFECVGIKSKGKRICVMYSLFAIVTVPSHISGYLLMKNCNIRLLCTCCHLLLGINTLLVEVQLYTILNELRVRFKVLNKAIGKTINRTQSRLILRGKFYTRADPTEEFTALGDIHTNLCDCAELINKSYQARVAFKIFYAFLFSINVTFFIYIIFPNKTVCFWMFIYCVIYNVCEIILIVAGFAGVVEEVSKTSDIICKVKTSGCNPKFKCALETFSSQLTFLKLDFTIFQLFKIDWPFVFSFLTGIAAYLVILIQLDK